MSIKLSAACNEKYAVGAFNVYNIEGVRAVFNSVVNLRKAAILQVHPGSLSFGGTSILAACKAAVEEISSRYSEDLLSLHLDHASEESDIKLALEVGVDSIMVDGSMLEYDDNLSFTAKMAALGHEKGVSVEAELGRLAGEEDSISIEEKDAKMTDPGKVDEFLSITGVDFLAVTIGNVHGRYSTKDPSLDWRRLEAIRTKVPRDFPLVLHGASGLPNATIEKSISYGICKFNVNTQVRDAYRKGLIHLLNANPNVDVVKIMDTTRRVMEVVVTDKIEQFLGTDNQRRYS